MTRIFKNRKALAVLASVAALCVAFAAVAAAKTKITISGGGLVTTFGGNVSPSKLPKKGTAPVGLALEGSMRRADGTHIQPLETVTLEFDKAGKLETKGLASCKVSKLTATTTETAKKVCGSALIGTGNVKADIVFPEQPPLHASGPLLVFNGSKGAKQELILHVYAHVPAATTFVVPVKISKAHGKFGTKASLTVPKIVSGQGSVTAFKTKIKKIYKSGRKKLSVLNAGCPKGSLAVLGDLKFKGGPDLHGEVTAPCKPKG